MKNIWRKSIFTPITEADSWADISRALTEKNIDILAMNTRTNKQGMATLSASFEIASRDELIRNHCKIRTIDSVIDIERS